LLKDEQIEMEIQKGCPENNTGNIKTGGISKLVILLGC